LEVLKTTTTTNTNLYHPNMANMNQPATFDVQTNILEFSYTHVGYQEAPKFKLSLAAHGRRT
jgi:hypothetical protein